MIGSSAKRVIVLGGGVAGLTAACSIQEWASVVVLERESQIGYHASGRSAALFSETYGNAVVRALSLASREALQAGGFFQARRGAMHFGGLSDGGAIERFAEETSALQPDVVRLSSSEVAELVPAIYAERTCGGVLEPNAMDIDTDKVLQTHAAKFRSQGGVIRTGEEALSIESVGGTLRVATLTDAYDADFIVNACGAWADVAAERAGLECLGLMPKRRTAFIFDAPTFDTRHWPLMVALHESFYFKPDAGRMIGSLADETDSPPCDAYPDDMDVALAVHRIEEATKLRISRPHTPWAGLRTFAPDRTPVVGFDPRMPGFFCLAGQGGYGFQVSLALARLTSALLQSRPMPDDIAALNVNLAALAPDRFLAASQTPVSAETSC